MVSFSKELTDKQLSFIKNKLRKYQIKSNNEYIVFAAEYLKTKIYIYTTKKILVQGKNVDEVLEFLTIKKPINSCSTTNSPSKQDDISYIGCDETGTGDVFGGIVCVAAYVPNKEVQILKNLGVTDSKKLSDDQIIQIVNDIKKLNLKIKYASCELIPEKYNELYAKIRNANGMKAYCHNIALTTLVEQLHNQKNISIAKNTKIVMDQFTPSDKYYNYLKQLKINSTIQPIDIFVTKAETKYIAVAIASILARYIFIVQMGNLSKQFGKKIPFGASNPLIKKMISQTDKKALPNFVKMHFKTISESN